MSKDQEPTGVPAPRGKPSDGPNRSASPGAGLEDLVLLRLTQVLQVVPVSRSTWLAGVKTGRFPPPVRIGPRARAWRSSDVRALVASFKPAH